jgi:hypothetical protein
MYVRFPSSSSLSFPSFGCDDVDGHTTVEEEEEAIMKNLQSGGSDSSSGSYHSPEDEFAHLLPKRRAWKCSTDCDPDYIPNQQEVW